MEIKFYIFTHILRNLMNFDNVFASLNFVSKFRPISTVIQEFFFYSQYVGLIEILLIKNKYGQTTW